MQSAIPINNAQSSYLHSYFFLVFFFLFFFFLFLFCLLKPPTSPSPYLHPSVCISFPTFRSEMMYTAGLAVNSITYLSMYYFVIDVVCDQNL